MSGKYLKLVMPVVLAAMFFMPLAAVAKTEAAGCGPARNFVDNVAGQLAGIMARPSGHERNFTRFFRRYADLKGMANFALGRYSRSMPGRLRLEYYNLAEKMVVATFTSKMSRKKGRSYKIWNCKPKGRGYLVKGVVVEKNGDIVINVHWLLMPHGKSLKIFDVGVAFMWMTQQQRASFRSVLNKNRGDFSALLKHMRARSS